MIKNRYQVLEEGIVRIVYNDSPANLSNVTGDPEKMNNKKFCTVMATVSTDGNVIKTRLFDTDAIGHRMLISSVEFIGDAIMFTAVSKKTFRQGVAELKPLN
ncbi:MAG: hypothetical protein WD824_10155 [Cyclobacteriaceae bacterium]